MFSVAILALLIFGERSFWSHQLRYQSEPIASVGQWSPIAGTIFAALGSLYHLFFSGEEEDNGRRAQVLVYHCNRGDACQGDATPDTDTPPDGDGPSGHRSARIVHCNTVDTVLQEPGRDTNGEMVRFPTYLSTLGPQPTTSSTGAAAQEKEGRTRLRVKNFLIAATERLGTAVHTDDTEYQRGKARDYPQVPGERNRNERFLETEEMYNPPRDADGMATPVPPADQRSRASSDASGSYAAHRASASPARASSPSSPPAAMVRRPHANTLPLARPSAGPSRGRHQSLAVPSIVRRE